MVGEKPTRYMSDAARVHNRDLYQEASQHFNEPVLAFDGVARLIGYGETAVDCYYIMHCPKRGVYWHTCVGGYTFLDRLKGQCYVKAHNGDDWDDFVRLDMDLTRRGVPPADTFRLELDHANTEDRRPRMERAPSP